MKKRLNYYQSDVRKSLHFTSHIKLEAQNYVREESHFINLRTEELHMKHMCRVIKYLVYAPKHSLHENPKDLLNGDLDL